MMPAFTHRLRFSMLATRTVTLNVLSLTVRYTYRNSSAVPQMSAPEPSTVHVPPANDVRPAAATLPMSLVAHPGGDAVIEKRLEITIQSRPPPETTRRRRAVSVAGPGLCHTHCRTLAPRFWHPGTATKVRPSSSE